MVFGGGGVACRELPWTKKSLGQEKRVWVLPLVEPRSPMTPDRRYHLHHPRLEGFRPRPRPGRLQVPGRHPVDIVYQRLERQAPREYASCSERDAQMARATPPALPHPHSETTRDTRVVAIRRRDIAYPLAHGRTAGASAHGLWGQRPLPHRETSLS